MNLKRIIGLSLLALGIILFVVGYNASQSLADQVNKAFRGRFTEGTTWYMVGGAAAAVLGLLLLFFGKRGKRG